MVCHDLTYVDCIRYLKLNYGDLHSAAHFLEYSISERWAIFENES
jgi:hypothetical protein